MAVVEFVSTKSAVTVDLVIEQGVDLDVPITVLDGDGVERSFASFTAVMQVRAYTESPDVLFEMSTANGGISTGDGKITLHFLNTDFTATEWLDGEYDLEVTSAIGKKQRIIEGHFQIDPEITR